MFCFNNVHKDKCATVKWSAAKHTPACFQLEFAGQPSMGAFKQYRMQLVFIFKQILLKKVIMHSNSRKKELHQVQMPCAAPPRHAL